MEFLLWCTFVFTAVVLVWHFLTKKYLNPYKLIMIFGKKGCGKTSLLTKLALKYQRLGVPVYTNEYIPGTYRIAPEDIGYYELPPNSVLLLDEAGMIYDNRQFKSFAPAVRDWFKLQRHRRVTVYLFSQTFDIDKKLRDLTDEMYLVSRKLRVFSWAKRINKHMVLNKSTAEAPSKIDEDLEFDSLLLFWCGSRKFTYLPKYAKLFDSFSAPELKQKVFEYIPALDEVEDIVDE